jgi:hypothetical protein
MSSGYGSVIHCQKQILDDWAGGGVMNHRTLTGVWEVIMKCTIAAVALLAAASAAFGQQPRVFLSATSTGSSTTVNNDQTVSMRAAMNRHCSGFISTTNQQNADFTIFDAHQEQGIIVRVNQFTISDANGDIIKQFNAGSIVQGMQVSCAVVAKAWANRPPAPPPQPPQPAPVPEPAPAPEPAQAPAPAPVAELQRVAITSIPEGADITVDNKFMGSTPSTVLLPTGDHTVAISKNDFYTWEREISLSGGTIKLNAELTKLK